MIIEINQNDFEEEVIKSNKKVLVDFWAKWCNPCKMMHPVLEELDEELEDNIKIVKIDIDKFPEIASNFGVMSIPTFVVFENGKVINSSIGMQSKDNLKKLLNI